MNKKIKILHIAWGFYPWRKGGLILYARDLMQYQSEQGYDIYYFFAGRKYPFSKTKLKRWFNKKITYYEILNSQIEHKGDYGLVTPMMSIMEPNSEKYFRIALNEIKPDVIHIHELAGLPSSLIDIITDEYNIPCIMTLADYFLLCPTLKLYDTISNKPCESLDITAKCIKCCQLTESLRNDIIKSLSYNIYGFLEKLKIKKSNIIIKNIAYIFNVLYWFFIKKIFKIKGKIQEKDDKYPLRRDINLRRLDKISILISRSIKVKEIYTRYIKRQDIRVLNPYLLHIDEIKFTKVDNIDFPIKIITLNALTSTQKGGEIFTDALLKINNTAMKNKCEFYIYGGVNPRFYDKIKNLNNIYLMGEYFPEDLNDILEGMHLGIIPSVWEEVFGYVGLEMLAKGIPLIVNNKGGITEYAINGFNSIYNHSASSTELVRIIKSILSNPEIILKMNKNIQDSKGQSYKEHFNSIMSYYFQAINRK